MELQGLEAALEAVPLFVACDDGEASSVWLLHSLDTSGVSGFFVASAWSWGYTSRVKGMRTIHGNRKKEKMVSQDPEAVVRPMLCALLSLENRVRYSVAFL